MIQAGQAARRARRRCITVEWMFKRYLVNICAILFLLSVGAMSAGAQGGDVFTATGVSVDSRAGDELTAKSQGIATAQKAALRVLLQRLTLRTDHDRLPAPDVAATTALVRDYSVDREKFGGGRYIASLTVRFKPDGIRKLLRDAEIPFAETASRPVLVLTVFQTAGSTNLWEDNNPWWAAWTRLGRLDGLLPMVFPVGDLSDVATVSAEEAVSGDRKALAGAAERYGAAETMVTVASLFVDQFNGTLRVEVATSRYGGNSSDQTVFRRFEATGDSSRDKLLDEAARAIAHEAEENWKRENLLERSVEQRIFVRVPIGGLADWLAVRERLDGITALKEVSVRQLSVDRAMLEIVYLGNADQLRLAMAQADLSLDYSPDTAEWTLISRTGR